MSAARFRSKAKERAEAEIPHESEAEPQAWELIDVGRYMPRRIRGSFRGRELG